MPASKNADRDCAPVGAEDKAKNIRGPILAFPAQSRKSHYCHGCDAPLRVSWHLLCDQCYLGTKLYAAIARYREAAT